MGLHPKGKLLALPENIRQGQKWLTITSTLAYYGIESIVAVNRFMVKVPGANPLKLFLCYLLTLCKLDQFIYCQHYFFISVILPSLHTSLVPTHSMIQLHFMPRLIFQWHLSERHSFSNCFYSRLFEEMLAIVGIDETFYQHLTILLQVEESYLKCDYEI
jgi:hypothetical protein